MGSLRQLFPLILMVSITKIPLANGRGNLGYFNWQQAALAKLRNRYQTRIILQLKVHQFMLCIVLLFSTQVISKNFSFSFFFISFASVRHLCHGDQKENEENVIFIDVRPVQEDICKLGILIQSKPLHFYLSIQFLALWVVSSTFQIVQILVHSHFDLDSFHLCLFDFPLIYQFYSIMTTLLGQHVDILILKAFHQHFKNF